MILTGSQVPISEQRNDGQSNLQGALIVASQFVIPEVTLFFDNKLFRGNRVRKVHASSLSAFGSPNIPPLLSFGTTINVAWDAILRPPQPPFKATLEMDPNVAVLRLFPGITVSTVSAVCRAPIKGVVLQRYCRAHLRTLSRSPIDFQSSAAMAQAIAPKIKGYSQRSKRPQTRES